MKKLISLSFAISLTTVLFAQQTPTAAIKQTINTLTDAIRKGDSTLLRSVFAKNAEVQSVSMDKTGKVSLSTTSADELATEIGTPHAAIYDERNVFGDIEIDGPLAIVRTSYFFYLGATFSHCGIHYFQLVKMEDGWKIAHIGYTVRKDNCAP
ncbi:MAG: nuclear transport factor 2 family protein [Bacteroidota bacterium]|nr:nuclear transport factor 2 family protein [Bacteroidota bacterium]MDP4254107.1 nuclear transport factor 2 family protein [Bacteroidota bacterium]MDP4260341.1 nuclear transport factor 2 family protein [Bacteroidota bacterium]